MSNARQPTTTEAAPRVLNQVGDGKPKKRKKRRKKGNLKSIVKRVSAGEGAGGGKSFASLVLQVADSADNRNAEESNIKSDGGDEGSSNSNSKTISSGADTMLEKFLKKSEGPS